MKKAVNVLLDVVAALLFLASLLPVLWIGITASIFLGVEWYEWVGLGLVIAFVMWRYTRWDRTL